MAKTARFGTFEVDLEAGELRKNGTRVRLPAQGLLILESLLERPGELVTREELSKRIWGTQTFVDFDHGLNVMVNKLREVLGDSAKSPRYIETVPRKGYRFIAPLLPPAAVPEQTAVEIPESPPVAQVLSLPQRARRPWLMFAYAALLSAATVVAVAVTRIYERDPPVPSVFPITTFSGAKDFVSFSPEGTQIAFAWVGPKDNRHAGRDTGQNRDIYIKLIDTGDPLRLTNTPEDEILPAWSPDGRHIAFLRREGRQYGAFLIPALGGPERRVCDAGVGLGWSPDGKTLAIASPPDEKYRNHIVLHSLETGRQVQLTYPEPYSDSFPTFSPDGTMVAFLRSFSLSARELMVVPAAGGEPIQLTHDQRPVWGVAWTADGRELVFSANRGGGENLWRIRARGGKPVRITATPQNALYPAISRQGNRLAYTEEFNDSNIYLFSGPGFHDSTPLVRSTREDHSARFSPDGERVVFVSKRTGSDEIYVVPRSGGAPIQLTSFGGAATGSPRWSPDGRSIAFDSRAGGSADIYVIDSDGRDLHRLTTEKSEDILPSWSNDGRFIYYASNRSGRHQIWKQPVIGGKPFQVTQNGGFECLEAPDGKSLYYTQDRATAGIWSVPVNGGKESPVSELREAGYWRSWGLNSLGLYWVSRQVSEPKVEIFDFSSRAVRPMLKLPHEPLWNQSGLSVSNDGKWLLYSQLDQSVNDLMLIENFR